MPTMPTLAQTDGGKAKADADAALDAIVKPSLTQQNRFMTEDGTVGNQAPSVDEQLRTQGEQPAPSSTFETEYAAAATPQEKAQVAARHGNWEKAYGNAQNEKGEIRGNFEKQIAGLQGQLEELRTRAETPSQPVYQPGQPDFQVVQPNDQYDTEADRLNTAFRQYSTMLGQAMEQKYGQTLQNLQSQVEGLSKMPSNYTVDAATETRIVSELGISDLPSWRQKQLVQQFAGSTNQVKTRVQTHPEVQLQRAVNYVEPSNTVANAAPTEQSQQAKIDREWNDIDEKISNPQKRIEMRRRLLIRYGVKEVDDIRPSTI